MFTELDDVGMIFVTLIIKLTYYCFHHAVELIPLMTICLLHSTVRNFLPFHPHFLKEFSMNLLVSDHNIKVIIPFGNFSSHICYVYMTVQFAGLYNLQNVAKVFNSSM